MKRIFTITLATLMLILPLAISGCSSIPIIGNLADPNVLYLQHDVGMYGYLSSVTYAAPPGTNVTLNRSDDVLYYSIDSGPGDTLVPHLYADTFSWVSFDGTYLRVADNSLVGDKSLMAISSYSGSESGFNRDIFGQNWVNTARGTRQVPDDVGYHADMPVTLTGIEGNGTAVLSYDNRTYALPVGQSVEFSRVLVENSTIEKGNVSFTLVGEYNMSEKITNQGWVKASNIIAYSAVDE